MPDSKLFLIDAHALCYRSFFAIKGLSTSYGQATNAVYGFLNTIKKILRDYKPDYMAVCFDVGKKTRRQERYAEYKIQRPSMPDDLASQIPIIKEVISAYHLPIFELEGFEADDVIATIASKVKKDGLDVVIVSGDKDMVQLLDDQVKLFNARGDSFLGYNEAQKQYGFAPEKIVDFIALAGDKTDNIPGVLGIGDVTAKNLIVQYGNLENVFSRIDDIPSQKLREKLLAQKEQAVFSKELATLDRNVPIQFDLHSLKIVNPDTQRLFELFKKLEFRKLAEEISRELSPQKNMEVIAVKTKKEADLLSSQIKETKAFAFLINRSEQGEQSLFDEVLISCGQGEVYQLKGSELAVLRVVFEDVGVVKICHDVKENMKYFLEQDMTLNGKIFDVKLAGYLLSPAGGRYDVDALSWDYLKASSSPPDSAVKRTDEIYRLYPVLFAELEKRSLLKLFEDIEIPLAYVLFQMEVQGVRIDQALLKDLSKDIQKKIENLIKKIYKLAGMEFNLNSPKQLSSVLFEKLKLPVIRKTKTGFSTDENVLVQLAAQHDLPAIILEYRQLTKLKSTYIDALPKLVNPRTKCVHASFNQTGTETGRLSSNNPNLQNIPIRTELGRQIRRAFIPSKKENVIISADYSQIELRILAHLSGDKNLLDAFKRDEDIHDFTASLVFDVKEKDVTPDMRNTAKRVNFGIIYGMSAFGLAKDLEIPLDEAQTFIDRYFSRYPKVKKFMDDEIKKAEENGFVLTLLNRRRYLPEIKSPNNSIKQFAQRQAINTPVQGSAADLIKLAMINIQEEIEQRDLESRMIISVHDELVFDVPRKEKDAMVELIRRNMENPLKLSVPIKTSIKIGDNWLDTKKE